MEITCSFLRKEDLLINTHPPFVKIQYFQRIPETLSCKSSTKICSLAAQFIFPLPLPLFSLLLWNFMEVKHSRSMMRDGEEKHLWLIDIDNIEEETLWAKTS